jgi:hypothetical protein
MRGEQSGRIHSDGVGTWMDFRSEKRSIYAGVRYASRATTEPVRANLALISNNTVLPSRWTKLKGLQHSFLSTPVNTANPYNTNLKDESEE